MTKKVGANEPCSCGSGKKFKKCCGAVGVNALAEGASYDRIDRNAAIAMVASMVDEELSYWDDYEDEGDDAETPGVARSLEERFWGEYGGHFLPESFVDNAQSVFEDWVAFDVPLKSGERLVDQLLRKRGLRAGEIAFLSAMKQSAMRPYEVVGLESGSSITLLDLLEGTITIVHEASTSLDIPKSEFLMARIVACGVSGQPEMEGGLLLMPNFVRQLLLDKIVEHRRLHQLANPGQSVLDADKELTPFFNQLWMKAFFAELEKEPDHGSPSNRD